MIHDLPRTFVLTVKPSWHKWEVEKAHLEERGIKAEAFICLDRSLFQLLPVMTFDINVPGEKIGYSQVCACMSHYLIWKVMQYLPDDSFWVLEDDAEFSEDWRKQYSDAMEVLPNDWDIVFLGSCCTEYKDRIHIGNNLFEVRWPMCGHGLMIRKKAVDVLLDVHQRVWAPLDIAMLYDSLPKLRVYTILPRICSQRNTVIPP